jgi:hypothetical protein
VISVGALTPILVCFHKLEITPPSNFNQSCDGTFDQWSCVQSRLSGFQEAQKTATIHAKFGLHPGIPAHNTIWFRNVGVCH